MADMIKVGSSKNLQLPVQSPLNPNALSVNDLDLVANAGTSFTAVFAAYDGTNDSSKDLFSSVYDNNLTTNEIRLLYEGNPGTAPTSSFYQISKPDVTVLSTGKVVVSFDSGQTGTSSQATGSQRATLNLSTNTLGTVADFPNFNDKLVRDIAPLDNGGMVFAVGAPSPFFFASNLVFANASGSVRKSIAITGDFDALDNFRVVSGDYRNYTNLNESSIAATIYSSAGTKVNSTPFLVEQSQIYSSTNSKDAYDVRFSHLNSAGHGQFLASWTSYYYQTPSQPDTKFTMRIMDDDGSMLSKLIAVTTGDGVSGGHIQLEGMLTLPNGGFILGYERVKDGHHHYFAKAYDALGTAYGAAVQLDGGADWLGSGTGTREIKFVRTDDGKIFVAYGDDAGSSSTIHVELQQLGITENAAPKYGTDSVDTYNGSSRDGIFYAEAGNDILNGNAGGDRLFGQTGNDTINGGTGGDRIMGGKGQDTMSGGNGAGADEDNSRDYFVFFDLGETGKTATTCDVIKDFGKGSAAVRDAIDLSAIDANNTKAGNQAFIFESDGTFDAGQRGQIIAVDQGSDVLIKIDFDGVMSTIEAEILVKNVSSITAGDFIL